MHAAQCSVHQTPFDNGYVPCTCAVGAGSVRHERVRADPAAAPPTAQDLSHTAFRALIALEAGKPEIATQLLTDLVAQSERSKDAPT